MKRKELVRWGIPALGFIAYVKWGGASLALLFAMLLFAAISGLIYWHRKDPESFYRHIRVIVVMFALLPAIAGTVLGALSGLLGLIVALPLLALAIWLTRWANRKVSSAPVHGAASNVDGNLEAANALTSTIRANGRRSNARGAQLHAQADNLDLIRQKGDLEAQNAALQRKVEALEREAALPPDPFADPMQSRSQS